MGVIWLRIQKKSTKQSLQIQQLKRVLWPVQIQIQIQGPATSRQIISISWTLLPKFSKSESLTLESNQNRSRQKLTKLKKLRRMHVWEHLYSTLRKKHLLKNLSEENSKQLSSKRLETNQELTINTVFKEPPHFLWLRKDSLLVSPF